jgi:hypothetical protein
MANSLSKTLGLDLPALAELLRSKGRGKDTVLAHITPKEAALLKKRGGRGSRNPDTGLLEFDDAVDIQDPSVYFGGDTGGAFTPTYDAGSFQAPVDAGQYVPSTPEYAAQQLQNVPQYNFPDTTQYQQPDATQYQQPAPTYQAPQAAPQRVDMAALGQDQPYYDPTTGIPQTPEQVASKFPSLYPSGEAQPAGYGTIFTPTGQAAYAPEENLDAYAQLQYAQDAAAQDKAAKDAAKKETDYAKWIDTLGRLGLGAATIAGLSRYVQQPTQATAANQVANAAGKIANIGAPYKAIGSQLMGQAQTGGLSPGDVQAVNAARAQGSQDISRRGGVGTLQYANSIADLTARLMDNQFKLGLATSAIGDQYALQAITTQLAGDQQINAANTNFYTQMANMFAPYILGASRATPAPGTTAAAPSTIGAIGP